MVLPMTAQRSHGFNRLKIIFLFRPFLPYQFLRSRTFPCVLRCLGSGFSAIFPILPHPKTTKIILRKGTSYIYIKMFNGTFAASIFVNSSFSHEFAQMYSKVSTFNFCFEKQIHNASAATNVEMV